MPTYVALLRGINVGGHKKVAMADLRRLLSDMGCNGVRTYIQSGNAVFGSDLKTAREVEIAVGQQISADLGMDVAVLVRTPEELADVVAANPFDEADTEPTKVVVYFLSAPVKASLLEALLPPAFAPEALAVGDGVLYLRLPAGQARSELVVALGKTKLGVDVTARNWRTVTTLLEMAS